MTRPTGAATTCSRPPSSTASASTRREVSWDQQTGRPEVSVEFDAEGARLFEALSGRAVGRKLAILLEGVVMSAPVIEGKIAAAAPASPWAATAIPFALQTEAKDLAAIMNAGALPAPVTLVETRAPR